MIVAGAFRLAFTWLGDRWVHSLEFQGPNVPSHRVLAISVEGDPDRDDPARVVSPAYQDLQFQEAGSTWQALLVGQSGPHHFSAVFEVEQRFPAEVPDQTRPGRPQEVFVRVDVADRCRSAVQALASTYTVDASSSELVDAQPTIAAWDLGPHQLTVVSTRAWGPTELAIAEAGRRATQVQAFVRLDPTDVTHRFQYLWHWDQDLRR